MSARISSSAVWKQSCPMEHALQSQVTRNLIFEIQRTFILSTSSVNAEVFKIFRFEQSGATRKNYISMHLRLRLLPSGPINIHKLCLPLSKNVNLNLTRIMHATCHEDVNIRLSGTITTTSTWNCEAARAFDSIAKYFWGASSYRQRRCARQCQHQEGQVAAFFL